MPALQRALAALLLPGALALAGNAYAAPTQTPTWRYAFAVVANVVTEPGDETTLQRLIDAIGRDPQISFLVYDGNIKGPRESCLDRLYERRHTLLDASRAPVVFVPGQRDWVTCGSSGAGGYDPVERLDFLRQNFYADAKALGETPLSLTRESEVSRFRPYRENVRWQVGDTVFVALNAPSGNNHYLNAGGRNGEFEDRVIANGFWLEHAAEFARRRNARAIVIFMQADVFPEREERNDRFAWLRFHRAPRDGYAELRRSLLKLADNFRGPIVIVNPDEARLPRGFTIEQPLRNEKGIRIANVTRVAFSLRDPLTQWLQIDADMARNTPLRVSVHDVPKHLPLLPTQPQPIVPDMPEISSMPDVTEIPGMQQAPDLNAASSASGSGVSETGMFGAPPASGASQTVAPPRPLMPPPWIQQQTPAAPSN
ncbi:hypothetical protein G3N59_06850 [Paraburkholderia sp. Ac-20340]|uniref:hypothetical protein n=1 Tax=Paraburkholderia sp. Ac-20340 TaxID=2703888 RepID=UPI001980284B|nr:hypothetical protein [Paraburkholderia sp. Ac-20340]MBN3853089.1 hypothetical protein [Paraburkholderia sp. Ac-20340]